MPEWQSAHLAEALNSCDDAIIGKTLDGIITSWNPAAARMFGYATEEAVGSPISIIIPPERATEEPEILARLRRGIRTERLETLRIRKDGRRVAVCATISPIHDRERKVIAATSVLRDVTARNEAADHYRIAQERLQATLTSIGDAVIVTDIKGCVEFLNPVAEALTGWPQDEAQGKPLEVVFHIVNEVTRQRAENPLAKVMREGIAVGLANHTLLLQRNGGEVAIDDSAAPIRNGSGVTSGVVLVFRDVGVVRAAENMRAKLSAIVESSDDAIVGKDLDGRITSWNGGAERIFGYSRLEAVGRSITMLIPPDRLSEEAEILSRLRRGERVDHFETIRLAKDRRKVFVSLTISPILDAEGQVVGASKIARDITDKKKAERELADAHLLLQRHAEDLERQVALRTAELKESLEELETFSSSLSHDLKGPLRAIESQAQIIREDFGQHLPSEAKSMLDRIIARCSQLSRFIDNVLSYARLRTGGVALVRVELKELVPRVIEEYPHVRQANAKIAIEQPLLAVRGHEALLTQVLANLVSNGVKFVAPGTCPSLRIWTEPCAERVRLWVEDNGIGIPKHDQQRAFGLFTRLPGSGRYDGSGIGLAVVNRAMHRMGGRVGLESEPGKGSRFWLELDAAEVGDGILHASPRSTAPASEAPAHKA